MGLKEDVTIEFKKTLEKVKNGRKGEFLVGGPKGYYYHFDGFSSPVDYAISCTWNGMGITSYHEFAEGKASPDDGEFTAIIKKRRRLLLMDKGAGYFASGITEADGTDVTRALVYFRCDSIATFIVASSDVPTIHIVDFVYSAQKDPLQAALSDLLSHIPTKVQGEEATNNG